MNKKIKKQKIKSPIGKVSITKIPNQKSYLLCGYCRSRNLAISQTTEEKQLHIVCEDCGKDVFDLKGNQE